MINPSEYDYLSAVWFCPGNGCDYMAALYKDKGQDEGEWTWKWRIRVYSGDQTKDPFNDGDQKYWTTMRTGKPHTEDEARAAVERTIAKMIVVGLLHNEMDRIDVNGNVGTFVDELAKRPWAHLKHEGPVAQA